MNDGEYPGYGFLSSIDVASKTRLWEQSTISRWDSCTLFSYEINI